MHDSLTEAIRRTPVSTHRVEREHWGEGRSISEINLRAATNASVIAIQRGDRYITALSPEERLQAGDVLYLVGELLPPKKKRGRRPNEARGGKRWRLGRCWRGSS